MSNERENNRELDYDMVKRFTESFGHPMGDERNPTFENLSEKDIDLRLDLVAEEFFELVEAVNNKESADKLRQAWDSMKEENTHRDLDLIETADAIGDSVFVLNGFAIALGIYLPNVMREITESNLSKMGPDGPIYNEVTNKVMKGPNYYRPDISSNMRKN